MILVVATADDSRVEFEFPGSVVLEFKKDAAEFELAVEDIVFIAMEGGVVGHRSR